MILFVASDSSFSLFFVVVVKIVVILLCGFRRVACKQRRRKNVQLRSAVKRFRRERVKYFLFCSFCPATPGPTPSLSLRPFCSLPLFRFSRTAAAFFALAPFAAAWGHFRVFKQKLKLICSRFALFSLFSPKTLMMRKKSRAVSHIIVSSSHDD